MVNNWDPGEGLDDEVATGGFSVEGHKDPFHG